MLNVITYEWLVYVLAFIPARYSNTVSEIPGGVISDYTSWVTHIFVHDNFEHLSLNLIGFILLGLLINFRLGNGPFILFTLLCGIAGASVHLFVYWAEVTPVIGVSAVVAGYLGGAVVMLYSAYSNKQVYLLKRLEIKRIKISRLVYLLSDIRVLLSIMLFVLLNYAIAYIGTGVDGVISIAWEAHLGGFMCGLICFSCVDSLQPKYDHVHYS